MNRYCCACGTALTALTLCAHCGQPAQAGAKVLVASFVCCANRLLWMRRAEDPQRGFWAIPAGFMELGETLAEAAARELREETGVCLEPAQLTLYSLGSITEINEVYVAFRASVREEVFAAGAEALELRYFSAAELPWEQIAFPHANYFIHQAYADIARGSFGFYLAHHGRRELIDQSGRPPAA